MKRISITSEIPIRTFIVKLNKICKLTCDDVNTISILYYQSKNERKNNLPNRCDTIIINDKEECRLLYNYIQEQLLKYVEVINED